MLNVRRSRFSVTPFLSVAVALFAVSLLACDSDDGGTGPGDPPGAVQNFQAATAIDTVKLTWTASTTATGYRAELRTNPDTLTADLGADVSEAIFSGLPDGVTYNAQVFAINEAGETGSNILSVSTNFFDWDEFYPTSLHATRQGKATFYNATPNDGFESLTGIPYAQLSCQGCHRPDQAAGTASCESCHDTPNPTLGSTVAASLDASSCGGCHGRQNAEVARGFSDVHRDAGMGCMDCHTLEDMHGDGTSYPSMLADGAIDTKCEDCHTSLSSNTYHSVHMNSVACATCHMQSVVTCYNCHFESEINEGVKRARRQAFNWMFMVNRNGKVHPANFQSVKYQDQTFVAMAPFYAHTIARNAVTACGDCHNNLNIQDLAADSQLVVAQFNGADNVTTPTGRIPVPFNYQSALIFDFLDYDPGTQSWSFLERGPDKIQLLYGQPLTNAQLQKLSQ